MRPGRLLVVGALLALGGTAIWQVSDDSRMAGLLAYSANSPQRQMRERQEQLAALCTKYSSVSPLVTALDGKRLVIEGQQAGQIAAYLHQAVPSAKAYVNGTLRERTSYYLPELVRTVPPADALRVSVSEQALPEAQADGRSASPGRIQMVNVFDAAGNPLGSWQGLPGSSCQNASPRPTSIQGFLSRSKSWDIAYRHPPRRPELQLDLTPTSARFVARPDDFTTPPSDPKCRAALVHEAGARDPSLQITTRTGPVLLKYVKADQTLPAVACSDEHIALFVRTPTYVGVMVLDPDGYLSGSGRIAVTKGSDREAFRNVTIGKGKASATLVSFAVDRKGVLASSESRVIAAELSGMAPAAAAQPEGRPSAFTRHQACAAPPALPADVQVHELSGVGVAWEYVQAPGQPPVPFRNVVVDAPLKTVAVSLQDARVELVWLIQATAGTDLRYVEVTGQAPQTVLLKNPGNAVVNVASDPSCATLFGRNSPSRAKYSIEAGYARRGEHQTLALVLLANGNPFVSAEGTRQVLQDAGFKHLSSLTGYFLQLKSEGVLQEATVEDVERFNRYYYDSLPLGRKMASWFRQDPGLDILSARGRLAVGYLVKAPFPLPKHPDDGARDVLFMVDKGAPLPTGDLRPFRILDANTLSCAGEQRRCPWSRKVASR
jgi:hypothetical protein